MLAEASYMNLDEAKKALVEIVKSHYSDMLETLGDNILDDKFSEDGMTFTDNDKAEGNCQIWEIEENILNK